MVIWIFLFVASHEFVEICVKLYTSEKTIKNKCIPKVPSWMKTLTTELNKSLDWITVALYYGMTHSARGNVGACGQLTLKPMNIDTTQTHPTKMSYAKTSPPPSPRCDVDELVVCVVYTLLTYLILIYWTEKIKGFGKGYYLDFLWKRVLHLDCPTTLHICLPTI